MPVMQKAYAEQAQAAGGAEAGAGAQAGAADDGVVDAEFSEVDENNKG